MMMEFHPGISTDGTRYFLYWDEERRTGDIYWRRAPVFKRNVEK
jgi:hypothetical protein